MKSSQVEIGGVYTAKVSGRVVSVRVLAEVVRYDWNGRTRLHWRCRNLDTGREIDVKSAARFRQRVEEVVSDYGRYLPPKELFSG